MNVKKWFESDKIIIHMFYIIVILVTFCIELFTVRGYSNKGLDAQLSLAGTLSGIILSVLAIMMTLFSEFKSDNAKDTLEKVSEQIEKITNDTLVNVSKKLEEVTHKIDESTENLKDASNLNEKIDNMGSDIDNLTRLVTNTNTQNDREKIDLYASYIDVFNNYVDSRDENTKKEIYFALYCTINQEKDKIIIIQRKILDEFCGVKSINRKGFIIGITLIFSNYHRTNSKFKDFLIERIERAYSEEIKKIQESIRNM